MLVILNNNKKFWNNNQAVKANTPFEALQAICDISAYILMNSARNKYQNALLTRCVLYCTKKSPHF